MPLFPPIKYSLRQPSSMIIRSSLTTLGDACNSTRLARPVGRSQWFYDPLMDELDDWPTASEYAAVTARIEHLDAASR
jgi:hypothetical protein